MKGAGRADASRKAVRGPGRAGTGWSILAAVHAETWSASNANPHLRRPSGRSASACRRPTIDIGATRARDRDRPRPGPQPAGGGSRAGRVRDQPRTRRHRPLRSAEPARSPTVSRRDCRSGPSRNDHRQECRPRLGVGEHRGVSPQSRETNFWCNAGHSVRSCVATDPRLHAGVRGEVLADRPCRWSDVRARCADAPGCRVRLLCRAGLTQVLALFSQEVPSQANQEFHPICLWRTGGLHSLICAGRER